MIKKIFRKIKNNKGYTLIFAVIISALVLSVGVSILNISKKEFLLASSARESAVAFYAADSGLGCAAYHDSKNHFTVAYDPQIGTVNCISNGAFFTATVYPSYVFNLRMPYQDPANKDTPCAIVRVTKSDNTPSPGLRTTTIDSYGYNDGWDSSVNRCLTVGPTRVERALKYTYISAM